MSNAREREMAMETLGESMETLGESRVRVKFNPSADDTVSQIKTQSAKLVDLCHMLWIDANGAEAARLARLAEDHYEIATMLAVKAATM